MKKQSFDKTRSAALSAGAAAPSPDAPLHPPIDGDEATCRVLSQTVDVGLRTVTTAGTVHVLRLSYTHPALAHSRVIGTRVPVMVSLDDSSVYVHLPHRRQWVRARVCGDPAALASISWREVRSALAQLRAPLRRRRAAQQGRSAPDASFDPGSDDVHRLLLLDGDSFRDSDNLKRF